MKPLKTDWYQLSRSEAGWTLIVLCGGTALFERTLLLTGNETDRIEEWGDYYVEKLALDVAKSPEIFGGRVSN